MTHYDDCPGEGRDCKCTQRYIERVKVDASALAETLRDVSDAGVSHALILPQLVLVFRESFGEMPAGLVLPGMAGLAS